MAVGDGSWRQRSQWEGGERERWKQRGNMSGTCCLESKGIGGVGEEGGRVLRTHGAAAGVRALWKMTGPTRAPAWQDDRGALAFDRRVASGLRGSNPTLIENRKKEREAVKKNNTGRRRPLCTTHSRAITCRLPPPPPLPCAFIPLLTLFLSDHCDIQPTYRELRLRPFNFVTMRHRDDIIITIVIFTTMIIIATSSSSSYQVDSYPHTLCHPCPLPLTPPAFYSSCPANFESAFCLTWLNAAWRSQSRRLGPDLNPAALPSDETECRHESTLTSVTCWKSQMERSDKDPHSWSWSSGVC